MGAGYRYFGRVEWREGIILVSEFADELGRQICHVDLREYGFDWHMIVTFR